MKKNIVLGIFLIVALFILTGCKKGNNTISENKVQSRLYQAITLNDKNINMFKSIIPEDWSATISSQDMVNSSYPFVETVIITNKDKTAKITILSQHSYTENAKYNEGINKDYYTTYLHQMDAGEYIDYFMERIYQGSNYVKDDIVDEKLVNQLKTLHNLRINLANKDVIALNPSNYNVNIVIGDEGYTSSKKEYQNGNNYYEISTSVSAISTNLTSYISSMLNSKAVQWYMPYLIIYEADSKENFDKYYDDYNFIIANSSFTKDYYAMIEYVSSAITNAYTSYYAAKAKAALDATNNYIESNYSSTSSASTQDKVREMWDDVIKEQDKYTLEDGSSIKTSIFNETVAQNGNEIYIGSKAGIPIGFTELSKSY